MRVALTEHIDKSPDKLLLRGQVGTVHSWVWLENEPRPSVVYVKFEGATWQLDGIGEPGLYPIRPRTGEWYLDGRRQVKMLKVNRTQLPLAPAYSMTVHASQGKTLRAVLLDLNIDKIFDPNIGTVASTRVRSRYDVLILRPFPAWLYQRNTSDGPDLLLRQLRGHAIDWAAYRDAKRPCSTCQTCREVLPMDMYPHQQWEKVRANQLGICTACKTGVDPKRRRKLEAESLQKHQCFGCETMKIAEAFPRAQLVGTQDETSRKCLKCLQASRTEMQCRRCAEIKPQAEFEASMVTMPVKGILCLACQTHINQQAIRQWGGFFKCKTCSSIFPNFAEGAAQRCLNCSSRDSWQKGEQTCRNQHCKRKWKEAQSEGKKRQRYCPDCRRK